MEQNQGHGKKIYKPFSLNIGKNYFFLPTSYTHVITGSVADYIHSLKISLNSLHVIWYLKQHI